MLIISLAGQNTSIHHCPVPANAIELQLLRNGKYEGANRESTGLVSRKMSDGWRTPIATPLIISGNFTAVEFAAALQNTKPGKAPGPDTICPEIIIYAGAAKVLVTWLSLFPIAPFYNINSLEKSSYNRDSKAVKTQRVPKELSFDFLCSVFPTKNLERHIHPRIKPIIDRLLPAELAKFRRGRSTVDQAVLLIQNFKDCFEAKRKPGVVFVNLTEAYDTVWHREHTCKLLRLLPDKHVIRMIMELVQNRSFIFTTGGGKQSMLRRQKNGVRHGSVLAHLFCNIYTYDLSNTSLFLFIKLDKH